MVSSGRNFVCSNYSMSSYLRCLASLCIKLQFPRMPGRNTFCTLINFFPSKPILAYHHMLQNISTACQLHSICQEVGEPVTFCYASFQIFQCFENHCTSNGFRGKLAGEGNLDTCELRRIVNEACSFDISKGRRIVDNPTENHMIDLLMYLPAEIYTYSYTKKCLYMLSFSSLRLRLSTD